MVWLVSSWSVVVVVLKSLFLAVLSRRGRLAYGVFFGEAGAVTRKIVVAFEEGRALSTMVVCGGLWFDCGEEDVVVIVVGRSVCVLQRRRLDGDHNL